VAEQLVLWLDDLRSPEPMPEVERWDHSSVYWVTTARGAISHLEHIAFDWISLDHDLGITATRDRNGCTGCDVVLWMIEHETWPSQGIVIHSWNPDGADRMRDMIDRYGPFSRRTLIRPAVALTAEVIC
jgi:hypothetical protein